VESSLKLAEVVVEVIVFFEGKIISFESCPASAALASRRLASTGRSQLIIFAGIMIEALKGTLFELIFRSPKTRSSSSERIFNQERIENHFKNHR